MKINMNKQELIIKISPELDKVSAKQAGDLLQQSLQCWV